MAKVHSLYLFLYILCFWLNLSNESVFDSCPYSEKKGIELCLKTRQLYDKDLCACGEHINFINTFPTTESRLIRFSTTEFLLKTFKNTKVSSMFPSKIGTTKVPNILSASNFIEKAFSPTENIFDKKSGMPSHKEINKGILNLFDIIFLGLHSI